MLKRVLHYQGLQSGWFFFWLAAVALAIALIFMLLKYERRLVEKKVGYALLTLRLLVLGTFFLTMLQPVLAWTIDQNMTGRIVVAVDLSESMETSDSHASDLEKLRWAVALNMLEMDPSKIEAWQSAIANGEQPVWVDESETSDPEKRQQLEQIRKETAEGVFDELGRLSRKEIVLRLLQETSNPLIKQLQNVADVELRVFAGDVESVDADTIGGYFESPPDSILKGSSNLASALLTPSGESSDEPILGVVLLSDGRDNGEADPVNAATQLRNIGARIFPVIIGSELTPTDLAIAELDHPESVFKGDKPLLRASINTAGYENREITLTLEKDGELIESRPLIPDGPVTETEFELDSATTGRKAYVIRVEPKPGETRKDNNEQSFALNVVDDKVDVLLIEGEARWEFRFLHNALERDKRVNVDSVVFTQPYIGQLNDTFFSRKLRIPDDPKAIEDSPFAEPDLVIIGDVAPGNLAPNFWTLLEQYVAESGGTVVFVAGKRFLPMQFNNQILDRLLPVSKLEEVNMNARNQINTPTRRGLKIRLTTDGENEAMFQFDVDRLTNRRLWSELPGHMWALLGEAKPAATVLATAFSANPQDRSITNERRTALIAQQNYGVGKVLWLGMDSTWRWRHRVGDQFHHRFWGQLGRWAADNKASAGNEFVRFGPVQNDVDEGSEIILEARWTRSFFQRNKDVKARVEIFGPDDPGTPKTTLELDPSDAKPLNFTGRIAGLDADEYLARLIVENTDVPVEPIEARLFVHEAQTVELSDLSSNRELLKSIAEASGGRTFDPHQLSELADEFVDAELTRQIEDETSLWDHWSIMLLFFALMTIEWVIRKLNGLP